MLKIYLGHHHFFPRLSFHFFLLYCSPMEASIVLLILLLGFWDLWDLIYKMKPSSYMFNLMNLPNVCDDTDDGTIVFINWWPILDWMTEGVDMNCLPISGSSIDCSSLTWPENYQSEVLNLTDMIIWTYLIHWGRRWRGRISEEWGSSGVCSIAEVSKVNKDYLFLGAVAPLGLAMSVCDHF